MLDAAYRLRPGLDGRRVGFRLGPVGRGDISWLRLGGGLRVEDEGGFGSGHRFTIGRFGRVERRRISAVHGDGLVVVGKRPRTVPKGH